MSYKGRGRAGSSEKHLWTWMVRLVSASTAIKYAKHLTDRLAFRLEKHSTDPNTVLVAASLLNLANPAFFQFSMSSQTPQYLAEPIIYALPLLAMFNASSFLPWLQRWIRWWPKKHQNSLPELETFFFFHDSLNVSNTGEPFSTPKYNFFQHAELLKIQH